MQNSLILVQKLRYMDIIKISGLQNNFAFVMRSICGAFLQKGIDQANKRVFRPYRVSKNAKLPFFGAKIYGYDQNIGSLEKFCLCDREHLWSLFSKWERSTNAPHY